VQPPSRVTLTLAVPAATSLSAATAALKDSVLTPPGWIRCLPSTACRLQSRGCRVWSPRHAKICSQDNTHSAKSCGRRRSRSIRSLMTC